MGEHPTESFSESRNVSGSDEQPLDPVADCFRYASDYRRDDWQAPGHGFE